MQHFKDTLCRAETVVCVQSFGGLECVIEVGVVFWQEGRGVGRTMEGIQAVLDPSSILSLCSTPLLAMPAADRGS